MENFPSDGEAAPLPAAQIAAMQEEMNDAIKRSVAIAEGDGDAPMPAAQIAQQHENLEHAIKSTLTQQEDDTPTPLSQVDAFHEDDEILDKIGKDEARIALPQPSSADGPHPISPVSPMPPVQLTTQVASPSQPAMNSQESQSSDPPQTSPVVRPPPRSMLTSSADDVEATSPSAPVFHEVEATLVPDEPVYDGAPVRSNEPVYDAVPLPLWKRHQKCLYASIGLVFGLVVAVVVGVTLGPNNNPDPAELPQISNGNATSSNQVPSLRPTTRQPQSVASQIPSLRPTKQSPSGTPSQVPSLRPTLSPRPSSTPSTYFSSVKWTQQGQTITGDKDGDWSGWSVAFSPDAQIMAVGSPGTWDNYDRPGNVQVYRRQRQEDASGSLTSSWEQLGSNISGTRNADLFGHALSLSEDGKVLAIGAPGHSYAQDGRWQERSDRPGYVSVYHMNGTRWEQLGDDIVGEENGIKSGGAVALSSDGKTLAVGSTLASNGSNGRKSGRVRMYYLNETTKVWTQRGQDLHGEAANNQFGSKVDISSDGSTLAVSAIRNAQNGANSGHVRVYRWEEDGGRWGQLGQEINGEKSNDFFGWSVSLSFDGAVLAVAAAGHDKNSGQVKVFSVQKDETGPFWEQRGQTIFGSVLERLGTSATLSSDGTTLAVSSQKHVEGNPQANYLYPPLEKTAGFARIYRLDESDWVPLGEDIYGEARSVALSSDGNTIVVGSPWTDDGKLAWKSRGSVRVLSTNRE